MKSNDSKYLVPLSRRQADLIKQVDEFYWNGQTEQARFLETQLDEVNDLLDRGEAWYPTF